MVHLGRRELRLGVQQKGASKDGPLWEKGTEVLRRTAAGRCIKGWSTLGDEN